MAMHGQRNPCGFKDMQILTDFEKFGIHIEAEVINITAI
jgi:hypothetical protein